MTGYGRLVRFLAPRVLLVCPVLYSLDQPSPALSILGAICLGIGLSATYLLLEEVAEALRAKKTE